MATGNKKDILIVDYVYLCMSQFLYPPKILGIRRCCLTPVPVFRARQGLVASESEKSQGAEENTAASENDTCITMNADVIQL